MMAGLCRDQIDTSGPTLVWDKTTSLSSCCGSHIFLLFFIDFQSNFLSREKLSYAKTIEQRTLSGTGLHNHPFGRHPSTWS